MYQIKMPMSPSVMFCGLFAQKNSLLSLAISLTVCVYSSGLQYTLTNFLEKCNLEFRKKSLYQWSKMDKERIVKGDHSEREERKKCTKTKQKKTNHST